jgi:cysteine desulfurase
MRRPIYLDHHATTPIDPDVVEAMLPWLRDHFGNAGSSQHAWGMRAGAAVEHAREQVASLIGAMPREIVFTSGATESNNLAILGTAEASTKRHLVTCATEHKAVLDPVRYLCDRGWTSTVLPVDASGRLDPDDVAAAITDDTALVSVMTANNEIGVLHPIAEIAAVCRERGVQFHTDAAQVTGKVPLDVRASGVDLMSLTAHKTHGPKGIGALYVRAGRPRVALAPRLHGGGQERGLRSGTLPVPMCVALGKTMALAARDLEAGEPERLRTLRDRLFAGLQALGGVTLNGDAEHRLPNNLNVLIEGARAAALMVALRPLGCSAGSACSTENPKPSHVLLALGRTREQAMSTLRFGLGRTTTDDDITDALAMLADAVPAVRA